MDLTAEIVRKYVKFFVFSKRDDYFSIYCLLNLVVIYMEVESLH